MADFIGRAEFIDGVVVEQNEAVLIVKALGEVVTLKNVKGTFSKHQEVTLIVRPEMVRVKKSGELFKGIVKRAVFLGDVIEYDVEVNGKLLIGVETDPSVIVLFNEGEEVTVGFSEGSIQVLPMAE